MESDRQSPSQDTIIQPRPNTPGGTNMALATMVPHPSSGLPEATPSPTGPVPVHRGDEPAGDPPGPSRVAYLHQRFETEKEASNLLMASWRKKTTKSYNLLFQKWVGWCKEWGSDPISGPISEVANFLAHLFELGYQYCSLNAYLSAISSTHDRVDGFSVGQHPTITRLLAGARNSRPPLPKYSATWDIQKVLAHLEKLGHNENLSLKDLTQKTTMLLALTRPSRSADLCQLDLFSQAPIQRQIPHPPHLSVQDQALLWEEVMKLKEKGAIQELPPSQETGFYSNLFLVPKKDGSTRPVINLRALNQFVPTEHFKMEGIQMLRDLLRQGDWLTKLDLKDAYFSIPIAPEYQRYLRFTVENHYF